MSSKEIKPKALTGKTVLVIEDDVMILKVYTKWLTSAGAEVLVASDGYQGLKILDSQSADIVLLDLGMPGLNGFETLIQLRERPQLATVPVIILSNTVLKEDSSEFKELQAGGVIYVLKKYETSLKEIVQCINAHLSASQQS